MIDTVMIPIPTMKIFAKLWRDVFGEDYTPAKYQAALACNDARLDGVVTISGKTASGEELASSSALRNVAELGSRLINV